MFEPDGAGVFPTGMAFVLRLGKDLAASIELVRTSNGLWGYGYEVTAGKRGDGEYAFIDDCVKQRKEAVMRAADVLLVKLEGFKKFGAVSDTLEAQVTRIRKACECEVEEIADEVESLPAPEFVAEVRPDVPIDFLKVDVEAAAAALRAETKTITDVIGPKPHRQKDGERYKVWNSLRMKILRKAGLAS